MLNIFLAIIYIVCALSLVAGVLLFTLAVVLKLFGSYK